MNIRLFFVLLISLMASIHVQSQEYWSRTFRVANINEYLVECLAKDNQIFVFGLSFAKPGMPIISAKLSGAGDIIATNSYDNPNGIWLSLFPSLSEHDGALHLSGERVKSASDITSWGFQFNLPELAPDTIWKVPTQGNYGFNAEGHQRLTDDVLLFYGDGRKLGIANPYAQLVATDNEGAFLWETSFGEMDIFKYKITSPLTWLNDTILLGISTKRSNVPMTNARIVVFGVSPAGQLLFTKDMDWHFDFVTSPERFPLIHSMDDTTFLFSTYTSTSFEESPPPHGYIVAMDTSFQELWRVFRGQNAELFEYHILRIVRMDNGDFIAVGSKWQYVEKSDTSLMQRVGWASRFTSDGDVLWERHYALEEGLTSWAHALYDVYVDEDESIIMVGRVIDSIGGVIPNNYAYTKNWVLKVGPDGCLVPGCSEQVILLPTEETFRILPDDFLRIYPNPVKDVLQISWEALPDDEAFLSAHDISGRLLGTWAIKEPSGTLSLDVRHWPSGVAILSLRSEHWMTLPQKILIDD